MMEIFVICACAA